MARTGLRLRRASAEAAIGISKAPGTRTISTAEAPAASNTDRAASSIGSVYSELYLEQTMANRPSVRRGSFRVGALSMGIWAWAIQSEVPVSKR